MRNDIRLGLAVLQSYIRPSGSINLTDISVHAEDFVADLLNSVHGWRLVNANTTKSNFPCIDLLDTTSRIGVQVTAEKGAQKVNNTISCIEKHKLSTYFSRLKIFSLIQKQGSYSISQSATGVAFLWKNDVLDFDDVLRQVQAISDHQHLEKIHRVVTSAMPAIFADQRERLAKTRDNLAQDLAVFDREVMNAPFHKEDPALMYQAIRQMRISLQKRASSRSASAIAANNFKAARDILKSAEYDIRERIPILHDIALGHRSYADAQTEDLSGSIERMMEIRDDLTPLILELEQELARIDALL